MTEIEIFDLEVYSNYFLAVFYNKSTSKITTFTIYHYHDDEETININNYGKLYDFLEEDKYFVGYNNSYYDNQILEYLYQYNYLFKNKIPEEICESLYKLSVAIINNDFKGFRYSNSFKSFDLMRLGGGNGLMKSLKSVGCNLKRPKIQDLPIKYNALIKPSDLNNLTEYCIKDVKDTDALFDNLKDKIKNRIHTYNKFKLFVMNETDSGVADRLLEHFYTEKTKETIYSARNKRIFPSKVSINDCIPEDLIFYSKEIKEFVKKLRELDVDTSRKKITIENAPILEFDDVKYQVGAGGLHSMDEGGKFESDEEFEYIDADVTSYYPRIMVNNKFKPRHLNDGLLDIQEYLMDYRIQAAMDGDLATADIFKIVINSIFGPRGIREGYARLAGWIDANADLLAIVPPAATALGFVRYDLDLPSEAVAEALRREADVLVAPGATFGVEQHLRITHGLRARPPRRGARACGTGPARAGGHRGLSGR